MRSIISAFLGGAVAALAATTVGTAAHGDTPPPQHSRLQARSVLPARSYRAGSPASGAFFSSSELATAAGNQVAPTGTPPSYFAEQPVQGFSSLVPAGDGTWWALSDNGYGTRTNSADYQLAIYRVDPRFGEAGGPQVLSTIVLRDPGRKVRWTISCDQASGTPLPPFDFNAMPPPTAACGSDPAARLLTGFDFDPESMQIGPDGSFWIGDEFGPFLLNVGRDGQLLAAPFQADGFKAPQNATLDVLNGERPTVAQSRGFESLAISPDRRHLYPMLEGAIASDDVQTLRVLEFDLMERRFTGATTKVRLEMPGGKVNLAALNVVVDGAKRPAYPGTQPPSGTGGQSAAELTAISGHRYLMVERDGNGDGLDAPRFKKVFVVDTAQRQRGYASKSLLVDLMAVPDPGGVGGDGAFFRFPFNTIESVHVASDTSIVLANDNNVPFSNGRARASGAPDRSGPLAPDDNELILIEVGSKLGVDQRLLKPPR